MRTDRMFKFHLPLTHWSCYQSRIGTFWISGTHIGRWTLSQQTCDWQKMQVLGFHPWYWDKYLWTCEKLILNWIGLNPSLLPKKGANSLLVRLILSDLLIYSWLFEKFLVSKFRNMLPNFNHVVFCYCCYHWVWIYFFIFLFIEGYWPYT